MLPAVDVSGSVTGAKTDKSGLFEYELSENGMPIIKYAEENCQNDKGKPDYTKVRPVLFEFPNYQYLRTGDVIGKCLSFKDKN